jgi:hypothetical protein
LTTVGTVAMRTRLPALENSTISTDLGNALDWPDAATLSRLQPNASALSDKAAPVRKRRRPGE